MTNQKVIRGVLIGSLIGLLTALAVVALVRRDHRGSQATRPSENSTLQVNEQWRSDPSLVGYRRLLQIDLPAGKVRTIAIGPDDALYVANDRQVLVISGEGESLRTIPLEKPARCMAVGSADHVEPGRLYVVEDSQWEVFAAEGTRLAVWSVSAPGCLPTSLAVAAQDIFLADAARHVILRYDTEGREVGRIGESGEDGRVPGFIVPAPVFDVAIGHDGMLLVVNPGARRIEKFTFEGDLVTAWGESSSDVAGFFGCCNPAHIAVLPDGRIVTSEKGIPRIKRYGTTGSFECLVAGPGELGLSTSSVAVPREDPSQLVFEIAADSRDRILVLDSQRGRVLVFEPIERSLRGNS